MNGFNKIVNDMLDFALAAKMMFAAFTQFKEAGFNEEQSFELTREILIDSLSKNQ
ncbi:hypothetical protein [Bacillus cereus group sp. BceL301]|uniref:hypothetical protein n=1 Tax=Bacillus cereus group sp. BceL301 TaxID=3444984 RepID=UPI003F204DDC